MVDRSRHLVVIACLCLLGTVIGAGGSARAAIVRPPDDLVWLALGDSYSSGEGLRYVDQQANPPGKNCERANGRTSVNNGNGSRAYAKVAYDELRGNWSDSHFELLACTGAVAADISSQVEEWQADGRKPTSLRSQWGATISASLTS